MPSDAPVGTCLITGAASGIGAACAHALAARGAQRLLLVDSNDDALQALDPGGDVTRFAGDVCDPALWEQIEAQAGTIDRAVLNAGIAAGGMIADTEFDDWRRTLGVNLDGMFLSLRSTLRKAGDGASIVLTASVSGVKAEPGTAAYGASKAGVIQLARVAAREAAARGIRVNAIAPGGVDTPIWDQTLFFRDLVASHDGDRDKALAAMAAIGTPLARFATASEIAAQILFLLSDDAATITGTVLVSDGGYSL
ncbi:glucose 1-dehydrogenase [Alteraurantiacibacter aestuarii]|uniref:SDR family oxidoreductase n=1 Tax=Alteraurantiacibacter aestuarii TaxID=650004 RepID=A0A844ZPW5_9SPHN|nr:SDR family oxidoreductase [Alteraurantiacibacter aestuarii]MXO88837.1 SDR family oxidoreductase [Alteraurantiacibacter aestuarii]